MNFRATKACDLSDQAFCEAAISKTATNQERWLIRKTIWCKKV